LIKLLFRILSFFAFSIKKDYDFSPTHYIPVTILCVGKEKLDLLTLNYAFSFASLTDLSEFKKRDSRFEIFESAKYFELIKSS